MKTHALLPLLAALVSALLPGYSTAQMLQIHKYGTAQGLPQSEIIEIYQDRQGYIWFGTYENGVARYDGSRMKHFSVEAGLAHASVRAIVQDRWNNLWIGTENGLSCLTPGETIFNFTTREGLPSNQIFSLREDDQGNLWVGTSNGLCRGVVPDKIATARQERPALTFTKYPFADTSADTVVRTIVIAPDRQLWAGTGDGIYLLQAGQLVVAPETQTLQDDFVRELLFTPDSTLWIGTSGGLYRLQQHRLESVFTPVQPRDENIYALAADHVGNLWIGTRSGLSKFDGRSFVHYETRHGLPNNFVRTLLVDYENNIWVGTIGAGAGKIFGWNIQNYTREVGLPVNVVYSFLEDRNGRVWIGTGGGGLAVVARDTVTVFDARTVLPDNFVHGLAQSPSGDIWVATNGGAARWRNGSWRKFTEREDGLPHGSLRHVLCAPNGEVWFSSAGGGAIRYHNERFESFTTAQGLPHNSVTQIHLDRRGRLWMATDAGLFMRDANGQPHVFDHFENLVAPTIYCICEDHTGALWFGTRFGGALHCENDGFKVIDASDGLPSRTIYFIAEDGRQRLWFGTNDGVAYQQNSTYAYLNAAAGLADNECNTRAALLDRQGWMWFGTIAGASRVNVHAVPFRSVPPRVDILALEWQGRLFHRFDAVAMTSSDANVLNFRLGTLSFLNENANRNFVMLQGFDSDWKDLGAEREIRYTNLAPKQYQLLVRGQNALGLSSADTARFAFAVKPEFYETTAFFAGCAVLFAGLIYGGFRFRVHQVRARERELEQAVAEKTTRLQETHSFLATVKESLPIGLLVLDARGLIVEVNRAAQELFGFSAEEMRGRELHALLSSPLLKRDAVWEALAGQKAEIDLMGLHQSGKRFVCQVHSDHVNDSAGRLHFLILTCENIDERKELEAKLIENEKQLAMIDLMAGMGDVLNNKLAGIQGYIDVLKTELAQLANAESARAIAWVQGAIHDMSKVIRQLIDCSAYLVKQPVITTDLRQELRGLEQRWSDKITFRLAAMPQPLPVAVISKFRNALDEAVLNSIEAEATQITIAVETLPSVARVRMLMTDNGRGIPLEDVTKVFLPFFKTKGAPHSGLGLWKLYQVIKQCGGAAEVVALPHGGTQLRLTLPLQSSENDEAMVAAHRMRMTEPR
ncbi:PAS domain S-box protein [candidate division KSB1 bacterium]|nr:PAS domain S-box protein [bacterium]NUM64728.1 PAS domain S-box protein [candidate division KSB1 bacterium]